MKSLVKILETQVDESDSSNFDVNEQISRNYRYFTLQALGNEQKGRSHYISPDVLDQVQSMLALFKETFLSSRQVSRFVCNGQCPQQEADAKTAYVNNVFERNSVDSLFATHWQDAFLAKRGVILSEWREDTASVTMPVQQMTQEQIMQMASQFGEVYGVDTEGLQMEQVMTPMGPQILFSGDVELEVDDSYVCLTNVTPENYFRDPLVQCVKDAMWATYGDDIPRGTLVRMGYDKEQVSKIKVDYKRDNADVDSSRKAHDQSRTQGNRHHRDKMQETVRVYRTWTWLNMADVAPELGEFPDEMALYEIHWAGGEILNWSNGSMAVREAKEMPFFEWTEIPISHASSGLCSADVVAHTQKTQSTLKRLVIDNQQMRNTTRYEAVQEMLKNPRDLYDTAIGGVIWSERIGSVAALAAPELSPLTMGVIGMLQQDNERRSGLSGLAKGMNGDAVRYQNADNMIERLSDAGKSRPMAAARDWANTCMVPLCRHIVSLAMEYDTSQTQVEQRGQMVTVAPQSWQDRELLMDVAVALTPQEASDHGQKLLAMHQMMSQDPQLSMLYGVKQKHALMDSVFESMGVADSTVYLMSPESPEYMQAMQQQQQQAEMAKMEADKDKQFQMMLLDNEQARKWAESNSAIMDKMEDNNREDSKFEWTKFVDSAELSIEREQKRQVRVG